jgi:hypothetical protein
VCFLTNQNPITEEHKNCTHNLKLKYELITAVWIAKEGKRLRRKWNKMSRKVHD